MELALNWLTSAYAVLLLPGLLICIAIKRRYFSSLCDIPGPFVASFSSLWQVYQLWKGHTELEMINLHRQHGDFVRISENEVSVSHSDAIKLLLHAPIPKSRWYTIFSLPDHTWVNQMSECDPREHIRKAKNVAAGYALSNIIKSERQVDNLIRLLERRLDQVVEQRQNVEFDKWFAFYAFDVVGEVTFSQSFGFLEAGTDVGSAISTSRALALYVAVMGHYVWFHHATLGNPMLSRLGIQPTSHIFDTCLGAVRRRKDNPDVRKDMMAEWESARWQYPDRMAESEVLAAAVANIGAGGDTTICTLEAFIYCLIRSPPHLKRLQNELDEAERHGELSDVVSYAEAQKMPFLQAFLKETYRFHSAVATGLPRIVPPEGITIAGRSFTPGTILSINPWVIHRNPLLFGSDADSFNPERWLDPGRAKQMNPYLIHWGAGYNQCPGRNLAHFEISKVVAQLIRNYEIEQVDSDKEWTYQNHFTNVPYGWPCRLKRRKYNTAFE